MIVAIGDSSLYREGSGFLEAVTVFATIDEDFDVFMEFLWQGAILVGSGRLTLSVLVSSYARLAARRSACATSL